MAVAKRNLAVQVVMGDAMVFDYIKRNTHHAAYLPQGVRYEDYAVPDGYGYGAAAARAWWSGCATRGAGGALPTSWLVRIGGGG